MAFSEKRCAVEKSTNAEFPQPRKLGRSLGGRNNRIEIHPPPAAWCYMHLQLFAHLRVPANVPDEGIPLVMRLKVDENLPNLIDPALRSISIVRSILWTLTTILLRRTTPAPFPYPRSRRSRSPRKKARTFPESDSTRTASVPAEFLRWFR